VSVTREDSYYPEVGDPGVDSLHHDLVLSWDPDTETLEATDTLTFRATADAEEFQLDLGDPLEVESVTLDGAEVPHEHTGKDLVVEAAVEAGGEHVVEIGYSGTPEPVPAPTTRGDFSTLGWTVTSTGEVWTMQEPYGAFTWYPVNDQPADKALYDFTMLVPSPWTGVANGELVEESDEDGVTTTQWHLAEPAATYLTTAAFGDFEMTEDESESGVPITYWTPSDGPEYIDALRFTPEAMAWVEDVLGPYPFDTFGTMVVDSESGMETQTMVTLGNTDYSTSKAVIVHELVHQWYGDQVTPADWRDLWLNEGMAMYLQIMWEAEDAGEDLDAVVDRYALMEKGFRAEAGPPGDYDKGKFADPNVYISPAVMYHELRERVGDETFFRVSKAWPRSRDNKNATRAQFIRFWEKRSGEELSDFFDAWLNDKKTPPRD
jgi:aminopeptidase N